MSDSGQKQCLGTSSKSLYVQAAIVSCVLCVFCSISPEEDLGQVNVKRREVPRLLRHKSFSSASLLSIAWCSTLSSVCSPLSTSPQKHRSSHSLCGQPSTQPVPMEIWGGVLTSSPVEPLSFVNSLSSALENLTSNMNNDKQFVVTKFFNEPFNVTALWKSEEYKRHLLMEKNKLNPGNKLKRFPLLCNKIGLLKFNQSFQNIANFPPTLLCCYNYSRKKLGRKLPGHCWYCWVFSMLFCLRLPNSSST